MYYKIEKSGCSERGGLVQIRFDLFFEPGDEGYKDHEVDVPIFPADGHPGKKDADGNAVDIDDYQKWIDKLPKEKRQNPFCCHFCQFEPTVTDEEILYVGELVLDMAFKNYGDLRKNTNIPVTFSTDSQKKSDAKLRVAAILNTDYGKKETIGRYKVK